MPWVSTVTGMPSTASECQQFQDALGGELIGSTPSQRLNAVELGWKQVLQDGRFRFNLTGWYYEWKNQPAPVSVQFYRDAEDPADRDGIPNVAPNTSVWPYPAVRSCGALSLKAQLF